jgi:DNA-directed RNA polymerase specialized sigma24 family protein
VGNVRLHEYRHEQLTDDPECGAPRDDAEPDRDLIATERHELLRVALADLPDRHRKLMRVLVTRPDLSYAEVGRLLAMPIGSIGPTRPRAGPAPPQPRAAGAARRRRVGGRWTS